jgi:hypothetical protein
MQSKNTNGLVKDFLTGRMVKGFIPDPAVPGQYLCHEDCCGKPTGHHNYAVCWEHTSEAFRENRAAVEQRDLFDREFMVALKICDPPSVSSSRVRIEIVMSGAAVRKARELHAVRNRRPLLGERRATGCGELNLGEIS